MCCSLHRPAALPLDSCPHWQSPLPPARLSQGMRHISSPSPPALLPVLGSVLHKVTPTSEPFISAFLAVLLLRTPVSASSKMIYTFFLSQCHPHVFTSKDDVIPANMFPSFFFSFQSEIIISSQEVSKKEMDKEVCPPSPSTAPIMSCLM